LFSTLQKVMTCSQDMPRGYSYVASSPGLPLLWEKYFFR
jgi:hypothetical protein